MKTLEQRRDEAALAEVDRTSLEMKDIRLTTFEAELIETRFSRGWNAGRADMIQHPPEGMVEFETTWGWVLCHDGERVMFPNHGGETLFSKLKGRRWKVTCVPLEGLEAGKP